MALWAGRFSKELDSKVNDFNSSISFDSRMYEQDINGSIAHAIMLYECGIIEESEGEKIVDGLKGILNDIKSGKLVFDLSAEDIHTFIEGELTMRIGEAGKRLHTARSRNDQVALDIRMYIKDEIVALKASIEQFIKAITDVAKQHKETVMPGYTHLQRAQPINFAHHLLAYCYMLRRDIDRLDDTYKRVNIMPLGSGALAGTTYPIDRYRVAEILGFDGVTGNSLDGVSDRDFCIELTAALSILMMHMSRLSEEIILWTSWEYRFVELDDAYSTGSSIMPQKKNPDITELVRGKTGRVVGDLVGLLTAMKGLPLAYNKDMQEDKEAVFDAIDTAKLCVETLTPMITTMRVNKVNMRNAAAGGFINATDCADYLTKKGMPFRDAYKLTGELVAYCIENNTILEKLPMERFKETSTLFDEDIYTAINLDTCVNERSSYGGPSNASINRQIAEVLNEDTNLITNNDRLIII